MNRYLITALVAAAIMIPLIFFWQDLQQVFGNKLPVAAADMNGDKKDKDKKKKDKDDVVAASGSVNIHVTQTWKLPAALTEISGMAYLNNNQFACIQDEKGSIFIYNTASNKIEKEISFSDNGDYEGIATVGSTAYVLRSDGVLFEVANFLESKPAVQQYRTSLTAKQDVEGLCYDKSHNRLLLAIKGSEPNSNDYKGIYAFNLANKQLEKAPVYTINLKDNFWKEVKEKKAKNLMQPADIEVHPTTGDLYIIEGANPKLLIMDAKGNPKKLYTLSKSDFKQPEGIAFTPNGELYISSEGGNDAGILARVEIEP